MKDIIIESRIHKYDFAELTDAERRLIEKAIEMTNNSYAPYSKFQVGAAVLLDNGVTCEGANQENAAYPSGLCAERTAVFSANARFPQAKILVLAIAARRDGRLTPKPISPCGACRQVIMECETRYSAPVRILLYGTEGVYAVDSIRDLLPLQFTADDL
ncbi:MAG: cytidine deaminase [Prevotella sp.]|nr:cytidine deaminase [Prevotella sp.]